MKKQLSQFREDLLTRMIRIYGFENKNVIEFCRWCEEWENTEAEDRLLEAIVRLHEGFLRFIDEDEEDA